MPVNLIEDTEYDRDEEFKTSEAITNLVEDTVIEDSDDESTDIPSQIKLKIFYQMSS